MAEAGIQGVSVYPTQRVHSVGPAADFVRGWLIGSPRAEAVARLDDATRTTLVDDVVEALRAHTSVAGLAFPTQAHIALAQA